MAERRRTKQKRQLELVKPSKEEYAIAKFLRFKIKANDAKLHGAEVKYFIASEAVDALLKSKWASSLGQGGILLTTRASCVSLMNSLLQKGCLFHRAEKIERKKPTEKKSESKGKKDKESPKSGQSDKKTSKEAAGSGDHTPEETKGGKKSKEPAKGSPTEAADKHVESNDVDKAKKDTEKKKKEKVRKVRFQMHENQVFKDGEEFYVWIYDPVSVKTFIIGLLLLLGVIAICLFPLWPPEVRIGISYLSWIAMGLLGVIFTLYIVRLVVFVIVWCGSSGTYYLWLLPNLNEDVGFWESFVPLYDLKLASDDAKKEEGGSTSKLDSDLGDSENKADAEPVSGEQKSSKGNDGKPGKRAEETAERDGKAGDEDEDAAEEEEEGDEEANDSDQVEMEGSEDEEDTGANYHDDEELELENRDMGGDELDFDTNNDFEIVDADSDSDEDKKDK